MQSQYQTKYGFNFCAYIIRNIDSASNEFKLLNKYQVRLLAQSPRLFGVLTGA
jgi:hypothetical protein